MFSICITENRIIPLVYKELLIKEINTKNSREKIGKKMDNLKKIGSKTHV